MYRHPVAHTLIAALSALLLFTGAQAQVFRAVGADGRVSYTDTPPTPSGREAGAAGGSTANPGGGAPLPYQLGQTTQRYPVTLYTSADCPPCDRGRQLLTQRGVPFAEKTVQSSEDIAALQRLTGSSQLPVLTVGGQRLNGYSDTEWTSYLDAAGYPKTSQLPSGYRRPAATPLVAQVVAPRQAAASAPAAAAAHEPSLSPPKTPTNPTGIRF